MTPEVIYRTFDAEVSAGDGRTLDVRVVPYDTPADVSDGGPSYREEWAPGCFDAQLNAANRVDVLMNFEHEQGARGLVGKGVALRSAPDGLHGTFRVFNNESGEVMLELVKDGILGGVSLEAHVKKHVRTAEGVIRRIDARLRNVALCRDPAFADARVLAVREQPPPDEPPTVMDEAWLPVPIDPALVERVRLLGVKLPERLEAHPA